MMKDKVIVLGKLKEISKNSWEHKVRKRAKEAQEKQMS